LIIIGRPPNFEQIAKYFPKAAEVGTLFAFDGAIYNPSGGDVPPALVAHEEVHLRRQKDAGPIQWWERYLVDGEFRYNEELLAHVAEFKAQRATSDRNFGARLLMHTALRLVAPLYNYRPPRTVQEAMRDLKKGL